jgi:type IV pilus assembly protein PilC
MTQPKTDWEGFAGRLAVLLAAGIPLTRTMEIMDQSEKNPRQKQIWRRMRENIEDGGSFCSALRDSEASVPPMLLAMLQAGERSGRLTQALRYMSRELNRQRVFRTQLIKLLSYPAFLLLAVTVVLFALSVWVMPIYEDLFLSMGIASPPLSRLIFAGARMIPRITAALVTLVVAGLAGIMLKYPANWREQGMKYFGSLPGVQRLWLLKDWAQWHSVMGNSLQAGLNLLETLELSAQGLRTNVARNLIQQCTLAVRQGQMMSAVLKRDSGFPLDAGAMLKVAEESGQLNAMFAHTAEQLHSEFESKIQQISRRLEPILILGVTVLVGFVAMGVMMPVLDASSHMY